MYTVMSSGEEFEFDRSEDPLVLLNDIKKGKISLEESKNLQQDYEKYIIEIRKGKNKFVEDYGSMIPEAKKLAKQDSKYYIFLY